MIAAERVFARDLRRACGDALLRRRAQLEPAVDLQRAVAVAAAAAACDLDADIEVAIHPERLGVVDLALASELEPADAPQLARAQTRHRLPPRAALRLAERVEIDRHR